MILIVGLGNPGKKYEKTRHNLGFMTIDNLQLTIDNFSNWKLNKESKSLIAIGQMLKAKDQMSKVILAKPQTFMNLSGKAVKQIIKNCKLKIENLVVVHDDVDLPLGKIRIIKNRGAGGHKGVESIIRELGTKNFVRIRIGIKSNAKIKLQNAETFVLKNFTKDEEKIIKETIKKTAEAIEFYSKEGLEKTQNIYNICALSKT